MEGMKEAAGFLLMMRGPNPQFLLMQHADRWDLPKGHAEEGEDILQTALRETEEESGVPASAIDVDPVFRFVTEYRVEGKRRGSYDKRVTYFLGFLEHKPDVSVTEHLGFQWWDWPCQGSIQARTIDPLLQALSKHFQEFPERLKEQPGN